MDSFTLTSTIKETLDDLLKQRLDEKEREEREKHEKFLEVTAYLVKLFVIELNRQRHLVLKELQ